MAPAPFRAKLTNSESVFQPGIFKGKVLFCTGGGSGICKEMTYAVASSYVPTLLEFGIQWPFGDVDETWGECCDRWENVCNSLHGYSVHLVDRLRRLDRITKAAEELSERTGNVCLPAQADVRKPTELKEAVRKTIEKFGKIDFVICGEFEWQLRTRS